MTSLPSRGGAGDLFLELTALISTATYPFGCVSSYPLWRIGVGAASLRFEVLRKVAVPVLGSDRFS
jgi:hypothetical protein